MPGIDFSNDPLLQGRLFSYTDTQISRLGGPNFHELPINRAITPVHNGQRDAMHRTTIDKGRASYEPNSIDGGWPKETPPGPQDGGFESYPERIDAHKIRQRSDSFGDHFSQARLFYKSMSAHEQEHIIAAYSFELGKVERSSSGRGRSMKSSPTSTWNWPGEWRKTSACRHRPPVLSMFRRLRWSNPRLKPGEPAVRRHQDAQSGGVGG